MRSHSLQKDLPKGHEGERILHEMHSDFLIRTDGKKGDFTVIGTEKIVELKSEISYSAGDPFSQAARGFRKAMSIPVPEDGWRRTDNLFVEWRSSESTGTLGGPWQAQRHDAEYYVHLFFGDGAVFAYRTDDIVNFMEKNMSRYKLCRIRNPGYITVGYPIPRVDVAALEIVLFPPQVKAS